MSFKNPIIKGFHPDPSICKAGKNYYLVTSSFEFFPGVPIFHSTDLVNWQLINYCLTKTSQLDLQGEHADGGIWAPTIRRRNGKFYMITTNNNISKHILVSAEDPAAQWSEPIYFDTGGIDPSLFFDDDGKAYLQHTHEQDHIVQSQINIETGKIIKGPHQIWPGTGGRCPEGPHLYKINDFYYCMLAEGETGPGHSVTIARSRSPWGPFEPCPHNPILTHRDRWGHEIQCTGHGDIFQDIKGKWWIVFLAIRPNQRPFLGRETLLAPVEFKDGWPVVNQNGTVEIEMNCDRIKTPQNSDRSMREDFESENLNLEFNSRNEPLKDRMTLTEKPGWLRLKPATQTLDQPSPSMLARRLSAHNTQTTTKMRFNPKDQSDQAGLTLFCNEKYHAEIFLSANQGRKTINLRRKIGDAQQIAAAETIDQADEIYLRIETGQETCDYLYSINGKEYKLLGKSKSQYLAWSVTFTGPYIGLFITSENTKTAAPHADFHFLEYNES
jgi:alpha-N-arabinofuranosidase